ncbi:hypothetical protein WELLINGTON_290 [Erwinia phage Wellington]|uniref:Uncharacterized protein n=1 Tax=Erwinia phage Wellington TaxID=2267653 RepID=A0A345BLV7_9CAUD|nr:hypothetical protein HOT70_gp011 [Erwinia phage Wellington]AXF51428.1 hypothetical protein WELLINGTON_290 [Erwinia phage Wellington]
MCLYEHRPSFSTHRVELISFFFASAPSGTKNWSLFNQPFDPFKKLAEKHSKRLQSNPVHSGGLRGERLPQGRTVRFNRGWGRSLPGGFGNREIAGVRNPVWPTPPRRSKIH